MAVRWIHKYLIHGEGDWFGEPFRLRQDQKVFLYRWYEYRPGPDDEPVRWVHRQGLRGRPRGDGKTELLAAIAMLHFAGPSVFRTVTPIIHVAASSLRTAGELFSQVQIMAGGQDRDIHEAPLCGLFNVWDTKVEYADGRPGYIERIAAEAGTAQGGKTTLFLADEVHEWTGRRERVHSVVSTALDKRDARELNITTAGPGRGHLPPRPGDNLAWKLYAKGIEQRQHPGRHPEFLFDWADAADGLDLDDPKVRRQAIITASGDAADELWSVDRRVARWDDPELTHHDWRRYFANQWVEVNDETWLADRPTAWADLRRPKLGKIPPNGLVMVGVDMALKHDSVGITLVHPLDDTRRVWSTRVFDADRGRIDHAEVMTYIRGLPENYTVNGLTYDPRFFELPAAELEEEGWRVVEFPQSPERMGPAAAHVYRQIMAKEIVHDGDPVLAAHVNAAVWRDGDRGRVLSKKASLGLGPIDALIAGVMATWELDQPGEEEREKVPEFVSF